MPDDATQAGAEAQRECYEDGEAKCARREAFSVRHLINSA